jgi:hypothetical protein
LDNEIKFLTTILREVDEEKEQKTDGGELYRWVFISAKLKSRK